MVQHCNNPDTDCRHCELKSPLFCYLKDEELDLVSKNKNMVVFRKGETICKQGTQMSQVISVTSGLAKLYLESPNQHDSIISIIKPSHFIGGPGIYLDQKHHYSVTALQDTTVCFIALQLFKELIDENRGFAHELLKEMSKNIISIYNRLSLLTLKQMPGRMADTLLYLFEEIFQDNKFPLVLSKKDLAGLSGMAKDSAVKVLREFQHAGIIDYKNNHIVLKNGEALHRISKTG